MRADCDQELLAWWPKESQINHDEAAIETFGLDLIVEASACVSQSHLGINPARQSAPPVAVLDASACAVSVSPRHLRTLTTDAP
jgi:hypothetical protein